VQRTAASWRIRAKLGLLCGDKANESTRPEPIIAYLRNSVFSLTCAGEAVEHAVNENCMRASYHNQGSQDSVRLRIRNDSHGGPSQRLATVGTTSAGRRIPSIRPYSMPRNSESDRSDDVSTVGDRPSLTGCCMGYGSQ
jgi:hypothetical protein